MADTATAATQASTGLNLTGRNVVVLGVADTTSIAWGIAKAFMDHGANIHIGYQQKFYSRVRQLMLDHPGVQGARCDITKEEELTAFFGAFADKPIDVLVHAIAFGPPEVFTEHPSNVSEEAFATAMNVSAFSLAKIVKYAKPYFRDWASVITLSYQASERAMPMYGLMGVAKSGLESIVRYLALELGRQRVRVNALSPGPLETLAALGITMGFIKDQAALDRQHGDLMQEAIAYALQETEGTGDDWAVAKATWTHVMGTFAKHSAIEEVVTLEDVANAALFLGSDLSKKITGQVLRIDCGLSSSMIM